MGPIGCPETSVTNHQRTLRNIPEGEDLIYTVAEEVWNHVSNLHIQQITDSVQSTYVSTVVFNCHIV
jgi:hypothetical protein